jgi:hypothetical protein
MTSVDYGTAEIHGPDHGHEGSKDDQWARKMSLGLVQFEFPLSCMLPPNFSNLIVAGRCVSVTHDVDKFARNMAPTGLMGQAAGTLAALMSVQPDATWDKLPIDELRSRLQSQGVPVGLSMAPQENAAPVTS